MDSLLSPPNDQRHKKDVAPMMPGPTAVTARTRRPIARFRGMVCLGSNVATACRRFGRGILPRPNS